jgi:hypothetical protein
MARICDILSALSRSTRKVSAVVNGCGGCACESALPESCAGFAAPALATALALLDAAADAAADVDDAADAAAPGAVDVDVADAADAAPFVTPAAEVDALAMAALAAVALGAAAVATDTAPVPV